MGQPEADDLAAGQLAERAVEHGRSETDPLELDDDALLEVPVVADGLEVGGVAGSRVEAAQRAEHGADAQQVVDPAATVEREVLGEVADLAGRAATPAVGVRTPAAMRSSVDLPEPLTPTRPERPAGTTRSSGSCCPSATEPSGQVWRTPERTRA